MSFYPIGRPVTLHRTTTELRDAAARSLRPFRIVCTCGVKGPWRHRTHGAGGAIDAFQKVHVRKRGVPG